MQFGSDSLILGAALYRFVTFWNLVLDDHRLALVDDGAVLRVVLTPGPGVEPNRFGHMLILKLTHGIASWLTGRELPLAEVGFAFAIPEFAEDHSVLFPARVGCDQARVRQLRQLSGRNDGQAFGRGDV